MRKRRTRQQLEDRVQDLRAELQSNKRGVLDAVEQRHKFRTDARKYRRDAEHVAWEREAGGRPRTSWRKDVPFNWVDIEDDSWRYTSDYATNAARRDTHAEDQLKKIAEAVKMVELTKTMLAENEARLRAKDFWWNLFWPITIWLAVRSRRASLPV